jgi:DHA1 family bicyclomycin/chloramphenicol resistance-like MFS transporter
MDVFVPAMPVMGDFFKTDAHVMQASLYLFMLTVALGQLVVGPLADQYGRRRISIYAALLFIIGSLLSSFAQSLPILLIARIIQAMGACGTYLICFIIIRDNFSTAMCARLFSILCGINALVASTAPVIGGLLLDLTHDWRSGFYFLMLLCFLMGYVNLYTIPNYPYPKQAFSWENLFKTAKDIVMQRDFRHYVLIASISLLGLYLFCALSPGILITQLHLSATHYGMWFGLNALTVFITSSLAARLTYSYPLEKIVRFGQYWIIGSCLLMIALNVSEISVIRFMFPMLCLTIGIGLSMGPASALALKEFKQQAATATALLGASQFGLAAILGILTAQWNPGPLILSLPVLCLSLFALVNQ